MQLGAATWQGEPSGFFDFLDVDVLERPPAPVSEPCRPVMSHTQASPAAARSVSPSVPAHTACQIETSSAELADDNPDSRYSESSISVSYFSRSSAPHLLRRPLLPPLRTDVGPHNAGWWFHLPHPSSVPSIPRVGLAVGDLCKLTHSPPGAKLMNEQRKLVAQRRLCAGVL